MILLSLLLALADGPDNVGNGGDPLRVLFTRAKEFAAQRVERANFNQDWLREHQAALAEDIRSSDHLWDQQSQNECANTQVSKGAPIHFSLEKCRNRNLSLDMAMELLIHESVHHLGVEEELKADLLANAAMQAKPLRMHLDIDSPHGHGTDVFTHPRSPLVLMSFYGALEIYDTDSGEIAHSVDCFRWKMFSWDLSNKVACVYDRAFTVWDLETGAGTDILESDGDVWVQDVVLHHDGIYTLQTHRGSDHTFVAHYNYEGTLLGVKPLGIKAEWLATYKDKLLVVTDEVFSLVDRTSLTTLVTRVNPHVTSWSKYMDFDAETGLLTDLTYKYEEEEDILTQWQVDEEGPRLVKGVPKSKFNRIMDHRHLLLAPDEGGILEVWDLATGNLLKSLTTGRTQGFSQAALSEDGMSVAAVEEEGPHPERVYVWDLPTGGIVQTFPALHRGEYQASLEFYDNDTKLISNRGDFQRVFYLR